MSKLEHLKMIERLNADEHYFIAEKIAKKGVVDTAYVENKKITNYITEILIKESDNTFWSCKLAIMEKRNKQEKINSFNKDEDEHLIYYDLIEELKADIELLDKDISNYYYRLRAIQRQLKKINQAFA